VFLVISAGGRMQATLAAQALRAAFLSYSQQAG
jgi:hypothetical protein